MMISKSLKNSLANPNDNIYTPKKLAKDCIDSFIFEKNDTILDAFYGNGVFYNNYPDNIKKDFTEIKKPYEKDFFEYKKNVDYIITNPPFSMITPIFEHTVNIVNKGFGYILPGYGLSNKRLQILKDSNFGITGISYFYVTDWFGFPVIFIKCEKNKDNLFLFEPNNYKIFDEITNSNKETK